MIGIAIGNTIGKKVSHYWTQRQFRTTGRSGLVLTDEFGNNASILPSCGLVNETNYLQRTIANFGSGVTAVTGGYIERRFYYDGGAGYKVLFSSCDAAGAAQQFNILINAGKPQIQVIGTGINNSYKADAAISTGWHTIRFASVAQHYVISVDGGAVAGTITGTDNGKWIGDVTLRDNVNIGYIGRSAPFTGTVFYDDYCDFNGTNKWYISGQGLYEYDVIGGQNMSWTGSAHVYYGNNQSNQFLDVGYSLYTKDGAVNEYIPYASANTPYNFIASMQAVGYIFWGDIAGDSGNYNIAPALIEFPSAITDYDRSNTTIHKAAARAGSDYDAAHPFRWRGIDVSNPDIYYSWKNTGYENKQFAKIDFILSHPTKVYEFHSFRSNLSSFNKASEENRCNIDDYYNVDIILMGDKTDGVNMTNNSTVNTVFAAQSPDVIIGVGDYDDLAHTTTELMAGITGLIKFASPGNHDDWVVGTRTEFNANFRNGAAVTSNGAYKKISLPSVDFFIYDCFLKTDESGYYTYAEADAITLAARQASTQGQWLINGLAASTAKFKVVVIHVPAWASDTSAPLVVYPFEQMKWDWAALGADLLLHGHFHFYERLLQDTGSGNIPIILCGTSGADQIEWGDINPSSIVRANSYSDAHFSAGHLIKMNVTRDKLQIDLSGIDIDGVIHAGKDQLILT